MYPYVHELEEKFAEMFDAFNIEYQYEPFLFALESASNGNVLKGFAPDFYLPELDVYVEVTSMNGQYCTRKRRKIQMAQEIYGIETTLFKKPEANILLQKFYDGELTREKLCAIILDCDEDVIQQLV